MRVQRGAGRGEFPFTGEDQSACSGICGCRAQEQESCPLHRAAIFLLDFSKSRDIL